MGYAGLMRFEPAELVLLDETEEIEIETSPPGGAVHRTIIWVVVDGEDTFIRSVNGATARWYSEAVANPEVTIHAGDHALAARCVAAHDPVSVQRTSDALVRKYAADSALQLMLVPETFETRLRVIPV